MQIDIQDAQVQLSKLIKAVHTGEDVVIMRDGVAVAQLLAISKSGFKTGVLKDQLKDSVPDFLTPMDDAALNDWEAS